MKRSWQILALLLLALMVPASVCCLGPRQATNECGCCSNSDEEHDVPAQPDVCPSDTLARSQMPASVAMPEMQVIELTDFVHAMMCLNELAAANAPPAPLITTAPPELRTTWVFVSRAALPARAPSELA